MIQEWENWIKNFPLPEGFRWYKLDNHLIASIGKTHYVYFETTDGVYHTGVMLDTIQGEEFFKMRMKNAILKIEIDQRNPRKYRNYLINQKVHIVAP